MLELSRTAELHVPGPPTGKGRPRFNMHSKRTYTPSATIHAEERVAEAWRRAGEPYIGVGPVHLAMEVVVTRPGGHFKVDGSLNSAGLRAPLPVKKPDLDNVLKLMADALNRCVFHDDQQITRATLSRRWAEPGEREGVQLKVTAIGDPIGPRGIETRTAA